MTTQQPRSFVERTLVVLLLAALVVTGLVVSWLASAVLLTLFAGLRRGAVE